MRINTWRRPFSVLLCLIILMAALPCTAAASDAADNPEASDELFLAESAEDTIPPENNDGEEWCDSLSDEENSAEYKATDILTAQEDEVTADETEVCSYDASADDTAIESVSIICYNPLYSASPDEDEQEFTDGVSELSPEEYVTSVEEAAAVMRKFLTARSTCFVIGYSTTEYPTVAFQNELLADIVEAAFAHTGVPTEGDYLRWQFRKYQGSSGGDKVDGVYNLELTYSFSYYTTAAQEAELDEAVASLIDSLDMVGSDYSKIKAIYDYVCENVSYDYEHKYSDAYTLKYTAYAALMNETAVCQGYALLLYRLALELGIDCRLISGEAGGNSHSWNIALVDGAYYNLDATWDAGVDEYSCFLVSDGNLSGHTRSSEYSTEQFCSTYNSAAEDYSLESTSPSDIEWSVENGVLTVSGTGDMPEYSEDSPAPWSDLSYSEVIIQEDVTGISQNAFSGAEITDVYILNEDCAIFDSAETLGDPESTVIHCYYNSTAEAYAEKYGYTVESLGYANYELQIIVSTSASTEEPVVLVYASSPTDLVVYNDIALTEPEKALNYETTISEETCVDGQYYRTVSVHDVIQGRCYLAIYVPGAYVLHVEALYCEDDMTLGERHMWRYGDVDDNGIVDARDATQIARQAADVLSVFGSTTDSDTEQMRLRAADVNLDGFCNSTDAQQVLCFITQQESSIDSIP